MSVKYSLSSVYAQLVEEIETSNSPKSSINRATGSKELSFQNGLDFSDETYHYIWNYVLDDIEEEAGRAKIQEIDSNMEDTVLYEKPIYSPTVRIVGDTTDFSVDLLWPRHKIVVVLDGEDDVLRRLRESTWAVYSLNDLPETLHFLSLIKE